MHTRLLLEHILRSTAYTAASWRLCFIRGLWNYATDEAVRQLLLSAGNDLRALQDAQVVNDLPRGPAELSFDVPATGRYLKLHILENHGGQGVGFYRAAFEGFKRLAWRTSALKQLVWH